MSQSTVHFLSKSALMLMLVSGMGNIMAASVASSSNYVMPNPKDIPALIEQVGLKLREAVNAANNALQLGEESDQQLFYRDLCFKEVDCACSYLKKLGIVLSSELHQNIGGNKGADSGAALVSSGSISEHLRDVEHSGVLALRRYLKDWKKRFFDPHAPDKIIRAFSQNDVEQKVLAGKTDLDLVSCAIFWEQLRHSGSPAFKEFWDVSRSLEAMQARCVMIVGEKMSSPQRIFKYFSMAPEPGSFFRKITDALCATKSDEEQIKADRTFANEFLPMIKRRIANLDCLMKKVTQLQGHIVSTVVLRREEQSVDAIEGILYKDALNRLSNARTKLMRLCATLGQVNKNDDSPENATVTISLVYNALVQAESDVGDCDMKLRQATAGWTSVVGLTYDQRKNLALIRSRKTILPNAFSGLYDAYATIVGTVREVLPQGDLGLYRTDLTNYLSHIEKNRSVPTVVSYKSQPERQSLIADWGWLARYGVPSVIPPISSGVGKLDAWISKFELARVIFGQQLENIVKEEQWLWPMKSLDAVGKNGPLAVPVMDNDCQYRIIAIVKKLENHHDFRKALSGRNHQLNNAIMVNVKQLRVLLQPPESDVPGWSFVYSGGQMRGVSSLQFRDNLAKCETIVSSQHGALADKVRNLRDVCSNLLRDEPKLQEEYDLKSDEANRAQQLSCELRRNIERYGALLDTQVKRQVSDEECFDNGDGLGAEDKEYKADLSLQQNFFNVLDPAVSKFCMPNSSKAVSFREGWLKQWDNYLQDCQPHIRATAATSLPTAFVGVTQARRDQTRQQYEDSCVKYSESISKQEKLTNNLYKYSFLKRMFAPLAKWRGWSWGQQIYLLKEQLQLVSNGASQDLRNVRNTHSTYKMYHKLYYAACDAQHNFYKKHPNVPQFTTSPVNSNFIASRYFSVPLDNR